jgi:hypothetical protein
MRGDNDEAPAMSNLGLLNLSLLGFTKEGTLGVYACASRNFFLRQKRLMCDYSMHAITSRPPRQAKL